MQRVSQCGFREMRSLDILMQQGVWHQIRGCAKTICILTNDSWNFNFRKWPRTVLFCLGLPKPLLQKPILFSTFEYVHIYQFIYLKVPAVWDFEVVRLRRSKVVLSVALAVNENMGTIFCWRRINCSWWYQGKERKWNIVANLYFQKKCNYRGWYEETCSLPFSLFSKAHYCDICDAICRNVVYSSAIRFWNRSCLTGILTRNLVFLFITIVKLLRIMSKLRKVNRNPKALTAGRDGRIKSEEVLLVLQKKSA